MKQLKLVVSVLILVAIALQCWQLFTPLPTALQPIAKIALVILAIHAVEGLIAAILILRYRLDPTDKISSEASALLVDHLPESTPAAVIKAGVYVLFVGTVGLQEVIKGTRQQAA